MTKADLINVIAEKAHLQHKQAEIVVNMVFDMMSPFRALRAEAFRHSRGRAAAD